MPDSTVDTAKLRNWLVRMRAGDQAAGEELFCRVGSRLERLAKKMLRDFPGLHTLVETDDVLQNSLMRLLGSLRDVQPESMRAFYGLAAVQIRRELLDLCRQWKRRLRPLAFSEPPLLPFKASSSCEDLERWSEFHLAVEHLPIEEREVVGLIFYHGWTQEEVADLLQVDKRTIRRKWKAALLQLHQNLGKIPGN